MAFNVLDDAESARAYALGYHAGAATLRCRYTDCVRQYPEANDTERITCPVCRQCLGLPALRDLDRGQSAAEAGDDAVRLGRVAPCDRLRYVEGWFMGATYGEAPNRAG